ncbi:flagellar biosynthesis protein FlhF [Mesobacillus zeae]|uniref:Flagellar biosynthesis protein FlhF n=1 Tax=Mesobacillus zeae TaxID=1917180 RepID=A0A398BCT0_9BACI|nr:flagellar biosynthesis protein FlhF [Mesobacillus zeae]RID88009.1 flagellar biosynthesis protein FlhF [Mesobacillus zeae]
MKIKKFTAPTMPEAMKLVRDELGKDAVILNSRVLQSESFLGFFKKRRIEVLAAVDPSEEEVQKPAMKVKVIPPAIRGNGSANKQQSLIEHSQPKEMECVIEREPATKTAEGLKSLLNNRPPAALDGVSLYPGPIQEAAKLLEDQEVCESVQREILSILLEEWYRDTSDRSGLEMKELLSREIEKRLSKKQFGGVSFTKKFINVAGPTGVGKTTTLAKIAADCVLNHKKRVAFITTDTYRIAAIEQLKTYAAILEVPLEVCYSIDDYKKAAEKFKDFDVVFVDTAGRNFRNKKYVEDLKHTVDFEADTETFLVLSLTSKERDMEEICAQFSSIPIDKFIFTKADETSVFGSIINMAEKFPFGVAYVTNGQDVPDDLIEASPKKLADLIAKAGEIHGPS